MSSRAKKKRLYREAQVRSAPQWPIRERGKSWAEAALNAMVRGGNESFDGEIRVSRHARLVVAFDECVSFTEADYQWFASR